MDINKLKNRFSYHPATPKTGPQHEKVRDLCYVLALELNELCPDSHELSVAIDCLDDVMKWANASIARYPEV